MSEIETGTGVEIGRGEGFGGARAMRREGTPIAGSNVRMTARR